MLPGGRLLVLEQAGTLRMVQSGWPVTLAGDLAARSASPRTRSEACSALRSIPAFATNGYVYLYRTRPAGRE